MSKVGSERERHRTETFEIEGEEGRKGEKEGEMKCNKRKTLKEEEGMNIKFNLYRLFSSCFCHKSCTFFSFLSLPRFSGG